MNKHKHKRIRLQKEAIRTIVPAGVVGGAGDPGDPDGVCSIGAPTAKGTCLSTCCVKTK